MPEPMSNERLAEIRGYIDAGVADIDVVDLFAEVERLRAELNTARAELNGAYTGAAWLREDLAARAEQVKRVRECIASMSWEHALVKARDIRRALDGTEPS